MTIFDSILRRVLPAGLLALSRARLPQTNGSIALKGLRGKVEVIRDRWGVPHIYADTIEDALFGQGFVHAQDRLFQMDFTRRVVYGKLSEVFGQVGLDTDIAMRTLGFSAQLQREEAALSDRLRGMSTAYCAGVNACIEQGGLPIEFTLLRYQPDPWQTTDSLSWNKMMFLVLGSNWESELLRGQLIDALGAEKAAELELSEEDAWPLILDANLPFPYQPGRQWHGPTAKDGVGSNNWVISGSRTKSGKPLLCNDMHLGLTSPSIFYQNHVCAENLNVIGVTFPGVPFVIQGHNGRVAWGFTNGFSDVQDLYEEHLRTSNGQIEYEFRGEWHPAAVRTEQIRVKGAPDMPIEVVETRHGPLINQAFLKGVKPEPPPLAMRWMAFEPANLFDGILEMNLAENCAAYREALRKWKSPVQNVVYADTQGNIGYTQAGSVPIRASGDGAVPLPGWTGEHEWIGVIHFEGLPHLDNPPRGYIATANNRTASADYPYYLGRDYLYRDRVQRITELIEQRLTADLAWMQRMQFDVVSPTARTMAAAARELTASHPELAKVVELLAGWDGALHASSAAAAIYQVWIRKTLELVLDGKLNGLEERVRGKQPSGIWDFHAWEWLAARLSQPRSPWWDLGQGEQRDDVLLMALQQAVAYLREVLGPDMRTWQWGKLHQLTFTHRLSTRKPLDRVFDQGPFPIGGDGSTVWATHSSQFSLSSSAMSGPPFRFIIDMADPDHAQVIFVPGQSGRPASPHYGDGIQDWFTGQYHTLLFRRDEIEHEAEGRLVLTPA